MRSMIFKTFNERNEENLWQILLLNKTKCFTMMGRTSLPALKLDGQAILAATHLLSLQALLIIFDIAML